MHQAVNRQFLERIGVKPPEQPEQQNKDTFDISFDRNKYSTRATIHNTVALPPIEIEEFNKNIKAPEEKDLTPVTTINPTTNFYKSEKPILQIPLPFEVLPETDVEISYLSDEIGYSIAINRIPDNTIIYAPIGGKFFFGQTDNISGISTFASIQFKDDQGYIRNLVFQFGVSKSLISEKVSPRVSEGQYTWTQQAEVSVGDPLFSIASKNSPGNFLPEQLIINISHGGGMDKDGKPKALFLPLVIKTLNGKAISMKVQ